jgi:hypothetical protein
MNGFSCFFLTKWLTLVLKDSNPKPVILTLQHLLWETNQALAPWFLSESLWKLSGAGQIARFAMAHPFFDADPEVWHPVQTNVALAEWTLKS